MAASGAPLDTTHPFFSEILDADLEIIKIDASELRDKTFAITFLENVKKMTFLHSRF